jgi:hypothetical protein
MDKYENNAFVLEITMEGWKMPLIFSDVARGLCAFTS